MRHRLACALALAITGTASASIVIPGPTSVETESLSRSPVGPLLDDIFQVEDEQPDDVADFDFSGDLELADIDLARVDDAQAAILMLDAGMNPLCIDGRRRPAYAATPPRGDGTIDVAILPPQTFLATDSNVGEQRPSSASDVVCIRVDLPASPDHADRTFIPAPGSGFLTVISALALARRRR